MKYKIKYVSEEMGFVVYEHTWGNYCGNWLNKLILEAKVAVFVHEHDAEIYVSFLNRTFKSVGD